MKKDEWDRLVEDGQLKSPEAAEISDILGRLEKLEAPGFLQGLLGKKTDPAAETPA